jgi:hypothetical protein
MKNACIALLLSALIPACAGAAEIQAFKPGSPTRGYPRRGHGALTISQD